MTSAGTIIAQRLAADLEALRDLDKQEPHEVAAIIAHVIAHLRSWKPESVAPLGTLPPPTERIADPRGAR